MVIKCDILTWELRYPQKRGYQETRESFGSCSFWEGGKWLTLGRKCLPEGQGVGQTMQINYKMNLIQDSCQRLSLNFNSTFHWLLQVYCIKQKMHISQESAFLSITLPCQRNNSSVLFIRTSNAFYKASQILRLATARMKKIQNPYVTFQTTTQFFFKYCIILQGHDI